MVVPAFGDAACFQFGEVDDAGDAPVGLLYVSDEGVLREVVVSVQFEIRGDAQLSLGFFDQGEVVLPGGLIGLVGWVWAVDDSG